MNKTDIQQKTDGDPQQLRFKFSLPRPGFHFELESAISLEGVTAVFGRSGSGKTTLLRCLAGLERAQGYCRLGEMTWQQDAFFMSTHKRGVGYVFQEANLFSHLTVQGNLDYAVKRAPVDRRLHDPAKVIECLGISRLLTAAPHELSGGQGQRVAIARALLSAPRLLLMDEPLASLDSESRHAILPYLEGLSRQFAVPIIYISHALDEVARIADYLLLIDEGRLQSHGELNEILTQSGSPVSYLDDASAVLAGAVVRQDDEFHLAGFQPSETNDIVWLSQSAGTQATLRLPGSSESLTSSSQPLARCKRVRILARDVSLALAPPVGLSVHNCLPAMIESFQPCADPAKLLVRLRIGSGSRAPQHLLAHITAKSQAQLGIAIGQRIYALIKSAAIL